MGFASGFLADAASRSLERTQEQREARKVAKVKLYRALVGMANRTDRFPENTDFLEVFRIEALEALDATGDIRLARRLREIVFSSGPVYKESIKRQELDRVIETLEADALTLTERLRGKRKPLD